ncbi:MBL fold metallo-hydrolase [Sediminibacillus halophilus]|uniref:Metallo-beta-lactamase superfamily protein n=1 Tax=Sediminibacillus halophilus TaxID=482461 RepID=A0A1G9QRJ3_9BACI|nr:MBL fold metallo-hydrolase [Sediminibacillus halophilus]SDM13583.1 Metallo-beta-lactamase superfamily protein [Sediminibacillus halophilus]
MENEFEDRLIPATSVASGVGKELITDLYCFPIQVVNMYFHGHPGDKWTIIDAGMPRSADKIIEAAENRYGKDAKPEAIILTHGHFDHVGAIVELLEKWPVPVYAHKDELPYLTGKESYPEPDSSVDGGLVAKMSPMFPNHSINISEYVKALPDDHSVPGMQGWEWIHTPGHTKGHVSLFREEDRSLIAGDAFVTVKQESLYNVMTQKQEISGPPRYLTTDWKAAKESVLKLNELGPLLAATGHGIPMTGDFLAQELQKLVDNFDTIAVPEQGRYT